MFTRTISHTIEIDAPAATVWDALAASSGGWNPFIRRLEGALTAGSTLTVEIAPPGGRAMTFKPTVLEADEPRRLRWLGRFLVPGLLDGEHSFELQPLGERTRFVQSERFRGVLAPLLGGALKKTERGFAEMNAALKAQVERR